MSTSPPPLLVTADEPLLDELLRLAAAAGSTPEVARDVPAALRAWPRAPLVLVGHDLADTLARASPSRREGVFVVLLAPTPDAVFRCALARRGRERGRAAAVRGLVGRAPHRRGRHRPGARPDLGSHRRRQAAPERRRSPVRSRRSPGARVRPWSSTPTRSVRASTGCSVSTWSRASVGTASATRPGGSVLERSVTPCHAARASPPSPGTPDRRRRPSRLSPCARCCRLPGGDTTRSSSTCLAAPIRWSTRSCRAATGCW